MNEALQLLITAVGERGLTRHAFGLGVWPLHDIVITNIVWYIAYKREVGRGAVDCTMIVQ